MKTRVLLICAVIATSFGAVSALATEHATLTPVWEKELVKSGSGEWDWKVPGPNSEGEPPRGLAVDNEGCIYVCDSYNDRVLVSSPNGERKEIIRLEMWIRFPSEINVDKDSNLYVLGGERSTGQEVQIILSPSASGWKITALDPAACELAPEAGELKRSDMRIVPLGCAGLRVMSMPLIKVEGKWKYQIFDEHGKSASFAPSVYRDQKGCYYDLLERKCLRVFSEKGELTSEIKTPGSPAQLVPYRGYIYVYSRNQLYRFAEDGTIEEEVTTTSRPLGSQILASPCAEHFYSYMTRQGKAPYSLVVTKWKYEQAPPTSEKGTEKK